MKMNIDDEMQASLLLSSLLDSWEILVVTVSNSTPNGIPTMEIVKDGLLNKEARRKEKVNLLLEYLLLKKKRDMKNKKGMGEVKVEIPMVLEEDPNLEKI